MEKEGQDNRKKGLFEKISITDTLILASIPIISYIVVYIYDMGYFSVYQLPSIFLDFSLTNIFIVIGAVLSFGLMIYYYSENFYGAMIKSPAPIKRRLFKIFPTVVFFFAYFVIYIDLWKEWVPLLIIVLLLSLPSFILPLFRQRSIKGYLAKLQAEDDSKKPSTPDKDKWEAPFDKFFRLIAPYGTYILISLFIIYTVGRANALRKVNYYVLNTTPERVVLWMTNDYSVCAPFNRISKEVYPTFIVINLKDNSMIEYQLQKVGPLKLGHIP